jgi:tetratricopeptide (TPR) repeat protein
MTPALSELLDRLESDQLDFKATGYRWNDEESRNAFVKDVVCMANTPRESDSHIITGVKKFADGTYELLGVMEHPDDADLQGQFADRVYPQPTFRYEIVHESGKQFGVFVIPPVRIGPCVATKDVGTLRQWQVFFRRQSRNSAATPADLGAINSWFGGRPAPPRMAYENGTLGWETLCQITNSFDPSFRFILILSPLLKAKPDQLHHLSSVPWSFVLDFDSGSDTEGVLAAVKRPLSERRSLHVTTLKDQPVSILRGATEWCLPRGLLGRPDTVSPLKWLDWKKQSGGAMTDRIRNVATLLAPTPVVIVAIWEQADLARFLRSALESCLDAFGQTTTLLVLSSAPADYEDLADEVGATNLEVPSEQLCRGLAGLHDSSNTGPDDCRFPSSSGAPIPISTPERRWLEEELELVGLDAGTTASPGSEAGHDFLRGGEASWYDLGLRYDIDRDVSEKLNIAVRRDLDARRANRINLYHAPGAGGTTLGKRILWNFHKQFPTVRLTSCIPRSTTEKLMRIAAISGLPVLVLADGASVSSRDMDELYNLLHSQHAPVVVLQVLRRFSLQGTSARTFFLPSELSDREADRFTHVYARENPIRRAALQQVSRSPDQRLRSAFYFGLVAFLAEFRGIPAYVHEHLKDLNDVQRRIVAAIAIAHYYAQKALPAQGFAQLLGLPGNRIVELEELVGDAGGLLIRVQGNLWRTTHELIATEVLAQILWPDSPDRRLWKQNLSSWAVEFAATCRGTGSTVSDELLEVVRRTFFYRDNTDVLGTERAGSRQFSQLIDDIPSREGKLEVLKQVVELFPEEAHFWAHIGRFYGLEMKNHEEAGKCIDRAIAINASDSTLYHMRGMSYRYQLYEAIDNGSNLKEVLELAELASNCFNQARKISPDDEHGYISEAQMLIRVVTYAGKTNGASPIEVLTSVSTPIYLRESMENAENLLEVVRRNREGEGASTFEEDCRAKLDVVYGRHDHALQAWDGLLSRRDTYAPPIRRQIVWTLLARRNREWDKLPTKEVDRIVSLLEQNLLQEPSSEANLRLWIQAAKRGTIAVSLDAMIEKVANWRARSNSLDATYYLYVLYALQAMDGVPQASDLSLRFMEECKNIARYRRGRTKSYEWFGRGSGVKRLVHHSQLGDWNQITEFWENVSPLERVTGLIVRVDASQAGTIELSSGIKAFFVPARGNFSTRHLNLKVNFYLGFSFDGPRAWEVKQE